MKSIFVKRILLALFSLVVYAAWIGSAKSQVRAIGAGALILDDGVGHTMIYRTPIPGTLEWNQWSTTTPPFMPLTLIPSLPPSNNAQAGFVYSGPSAGSVVPQLLYWIPPNHNGITSNGNIGGPSGAWDYAASGQLGLVNGTGTVNTIPIWKVGDTSIGDSHITDANGTVTSSEPIVIDSPPVTTPPTPGLTVNCSASGGALNSSTHFIDFIDGGGNTRGSIQGQDMTDLKNDPFYVLGEATELVIGLKETAENIEEAAASDDPAVSVGNAAKFAADADDLANWTAELASKVSSLGVAYTSAGADYAEYLRRADVNEPLYPGDIVGMADGLISTTTTGAQSVFAISLAPIVLGNVPVKGEASDYSKVAFLGQVPVKVRGMVHTGDFIVPSGRNDGVGMAISPGNITPKQFTGVLGRAWSASDSKGVSLIKVAIGLSANDMSEIASKEQAELDSLHAEVASQKEEVALRNVRLNTLAQAMLQTDPEQRSALLRDVVSEAQSGNETESFGAMLASKSGMSLNDVTPIAPETMRAAADTLSAEEVLDNNIRHLKSFDGLVQIMKTKIGAIANSAGSADDVRKEVKEYLLHPDLQTRTLAQNCAMELRQVMPAGSEQE